MSETTTPAAEDLRAAARLIRERADAATPAPWWLHPTDGDEQVWHGDRAHLIAYDADPERHETDSPPWGTVATVEDYRGPRADAAHIAAWDPAIAYLVADWLGYEAERAARALPSRHHAHELARALLARETSP